MNTQAVVIGYTPLNIQIIIIAFYKIFREKTLHRSEPKWIDNVQLTCKSINNFTSLIKTTIMLNFVSYRSK